MRGKYKSLVSASPPLLLSHAGRTRNWHEAAFGISDTRWAGPSRAAASSKRNAAFADGARRCYACRVTTRLRPPSIRRQGEYRYATDIAGSTALTERLGDTAFRAKARDLDAALRTVIRDNAGTPIEGKLLGDGVLAVFTSARQAIEAALACGRAGDEGGLPLHLGLHAGDVIREENNVYGGAVNIASRISGLSAAGEVLVSETVRSLARTSAGVRFEDRGDQSLKGVGEPVRVWAVREGE